MSAAADTDHTATDWRTHATAANQQRFADAQARLDFVGYPPGEAGRRQMAEDEKFTAWYDANVLNPSHTEFERQCEQDEFDHHYPEPPDGARIEWEFDGKIYAAMRQDLPEHSGGSWWLYGTDTRLTWRELIHEYGIRDMGEFTLLVTACAASPIPSRLLDQADILAKVGAVSREALYGLVATTWETARSAGREA